MDVKDAILSRRSVFKFKQEPVSKDVSVFPLQRSGMFIAHGMMLTSAPAERYVNCTHKLVSAIF